MVRVMYYMPNLLYMKVVTIFLKKIITYNHMSIMSHPKKTKLVLKIESTIINHFLCDGLKHALINYFVCDGVMD